MTARVVVAGAAGGIGSAIVKLLIERGFEVGGLDWSPRVREIAGIDGRIVDVRGVEAMMTVMAQEPAWESANHVVGAVGRHLPGEFSGLLKRPAYEAVEIFEQSLKLNLIAQFNLVLACLPLLQKARGDRSVTLISSVNGLAPYGGIGYSAAKAGLTGLMYGLLATEEMRGIRVNLVAPGTVDTSLVRSEAWSQNGGLEKAAQSTLLGKIAQPEEVAAVVVALLADFTQVTGEVTRVDGGQTIARR